MEKLKTVKEIAPRLNLTEGRLYQLIREDFFPANVVHKFNRQIRISETRLITFLEHGTGSEKASKKGGER